MNTRLAEMIAEIDRERTPQPGEVWDEFNKRMHDRNATELKFLRECIVELANDELSDPDVRQRLKKLADRILLRKAAYAEWRKAYQARVRAFPAPAMA